MYIYDTDECKAAFVESMSKLSMLRDEATCVIASHVDP